jgi:hypothetical protein
MKNYIFEVRHESNFKLLDIKGDLINLLLGEFGFKKFRNHEHGIIVRSEDELSGAFILFDRFGISAVNDEKFVQKVTRFLSLLEETGLYKDEEVLRIGCRITEVSDFAGTYEKLKEKYVENFGGLSDEASKVLDMELTDVAYPLTMKKDKYTYGIIVGPVLKDEVYDHLPLRRETLKDIKFADISSLSDIDCYSSSAKKIDFELLKETSKECFGDILTKLNDLKELVNK